MRAVGALTAVFLCVLCVVAASPAAATVTLSNGLVTPTVGHTGNLFGFRVTFKDTTGTAPTVKEAWVDGAGPYAMSLKSGSIATGALYALPCYLQAGTHNFRFNFSNAHGSAHFPAVGTLEGPVVSAKYDITDYFPLTETVSWTYHVRVDDMAQYWGHDDDPTGTMSKWLEPNTLGTLPGVTDLLCYFQSSPSGGWSKFWYEGWSKDPTGLFFYYDERTQYVGDGMRYIFLYPGSFHIPNGLYVGQTASTEHTVYNRQSGNPIGDVWCTYRVDGVETISVPYGTYSCLKLTISETGTYWVRRIEMWLAKNVGPIQIVAVEKGTTRVERLVSYTP